MKSFTVECVLLSCLLLSACSISEEVCDDRSGGNLFTRPHPIASPKNEDEYFFNYRLTSFAPATEPLIKETFGDAPTFDEAGF
ncbi:MAG: hypothetical protein LBL33_09665, partial [Tannerella sp.]|nr:hypothetical protein [Tannerella sp.]